VRKIVRRDVHRAHDPVVADVEDRDRRGRELEVAEEPAAAREREGEERADRAAVCDDERDVPARLGGEALQRRDGTVEQGSDRLSAEERRVLRQRAAERVDERGLRIGDVLEASSLQLAFVRPPREFAGPPMSNGSTVRCANASPGWYVPRCRCRRP